MQKVPPHPLRYRVLPRLPVTDPGIFIAGGEGGGAPNFGSESTVELFCGKLLLTEAITCFSICERRSPLVREIMLCEQRQRCHRRVHKNNYIFEYP